jgi:hypothetical protein
MSIQSFYNYVSRISVATILVSMLSTIPVLAIDLFPDCSGAADTSVCKAASNDDAGGLVANITSVLLYFIGAVAVVMIVMGGIKYATANGNPESIKSAKNTIMYSLLGLIAAIAAQALVQFVVKWFN